MTALPEIPFNPDLDLKLVRVLDVAPALVWRAYTEPALLKQWFCPKPWGVSECIIELWPGGRFAPTMRSPEGDEFPNEGCYLEVVPGQRLTWTGALRGGFRPQTPGDVSDHGLVFTVVITLEAEGTGTKYTAHLMHADPSGRQRHAEMGFEGGWGSSLDQLEALMKGA